MCRDESKGMQGSLDLWINMLSCPLVTDQGGDITPEPYMQITPPPSPPPFTCPFFASLPQTQTR